MPRLTAALIACTLLAAAGCGGDDRKDVRHTVEELIAAIDARDGHKFCDELVTQEYVEKQTFAKGDKAHDDCKRQLKQVRRLRVKLLRIGSVKVDGDRARVKVLLSSQGQEHDQLYRLRKEGGDWRIASGSGG